MNEARRDAPEPGWAQVPVERCAAPRSIYVARAVKDTANAPSRGEGRARPVVPAGQAGDMEQVRFSGSGGPAVAIPQIITR
ncbi:hypothetical protein DDE20_03690 [Pararhodobacter oceanensis]|uniref:Uncharacterized protein n=1 Tax=Pararhodobacter oceanensis TaxID=2172121 RepID=A0A2T8HYY4_9RHOB|nr:hypothetical protein DDE20_03690 [Pararhodobacter oceanensis]